MNNIEIKQGMYVRTNNGYIGKVVEIIYINEEKRYSLDSTDVYLFADEDIVGEPSEHIIDLIEPGDYVNGKKVGYVDSCTGYFREFYYDDEDHEKEYGNWLEEIETVVTKEQFAKCVYEVDHE